MIQPVSIFVSASLALALLAGCSSNPSNSDQSQQNSNPQANLNLSQGGIASPSFEEPSFPEDAFRSGSATEFTGYNIYSDIAQTQMDLHHVAFVEKEGKFYSPIFLYGLLPYFEGNTGTYDNVPEGYEIRMTVDADSGDGIYSTTVDYNVSNGDECIVLDRSKGDRLYVTDPLLLSDASVYGKLSLLPVIDNGVFLGILRDDPILEIQRTPYNDADKLSRTLNALGVKIQKGTNSKAAAGIITAEKPQAVTIKYNTEESHKSTYESDEETYDFNRYYAVAPIYHNPDDSGVPVELSEINDEYAILDLSSIDPGRYLLPVYGEDYLFLEVR